MRKLILAISPYIPQPVKDLVVSFIRWYKKWSTTSKSSGGASSPTGDYMGTLLLLLLAYFKELPNVAFELFAVAVATYSRFWMGNPPLFPVVSEGHWWEVTMSIAYIAFALYTYAFGMMEHKGDVGTFAGTAREFPLWMIFIGDAIFYFSGANKYLIGIVSILFLSVMLIKDYEEQGRYGVLNLSRFPLWILFFWIVAFGEKPELQNVKNHLATLSFTTWLILLGIIAGAGLIAFGSLKLEELRYPKDKGKGHRNDRSHRKPVVDD